MPLVKRAKRPIPSLSSRTSTLEINDYGLGFNSFLSNDKFPVKDGASNLLRLAQNARITTLGEYGTRKGVDFHSDAAGETLDQSQTSTTGASDQSFNSVTRLAQIFTAGANGSLSKVEINVKNASSATGVIMVEVWSNSSGEPGVMLTSSSLTPSSLTSSYQYLTARFHEPVVVASSTSYWIVAYVQSVGSNSYSWSGTTNATTALVSADSGSTWSSTAFSLNFKQYYATVGGVKGLHRAYKSDGTAITLFAHGTSVYSVDEVTGALTAIKTGLSSSATTYRFVTINDIVYYVNGFDGYRKWDFTTESQVSATNYTNIIHHKGLVFLVTKDDPNKVVYSNFAAYETFTSTDFVYVPAPKTGDATTAMQSLNGYLILFTRDNKYILSGDDNATFRLDEAPDQKGTYTQETTSIDKNFVYYLGNDGVYRSNGSEAQLLSENNYEEVLTLPNRDSATLCVNRGRLYLWFRSAGNSTNNECFVWNLNYSNGNNDTIESHDNSTNVNRALTAYNDDNQLLVGNSSIGQVYWQELSSNDYSDVGMPYEFILQTHYFPFTSPTVLKEVRYWKPRFSAQSGNYSVRCEFATELRDNWQLYQSINTQGSGATYGSGVEYGDGTTYGTSAEEEGSFYVPGEFKRIALRYYHSATRQPHTFLGHTLVVQSRRIR